MKKVLMSACALAVVLGFVACGDTKKEEAAPVAPVETPAAEMPAADTNATETPAVETNTTEANATETPAK